MGEQHITCKLIMKEKSRNGFLVLINFVNHFKIAKVMRIFFTLILRILPFPKNLPFKLHPVISLSLFLSLFIFLPAFLPYSMHSSVPFLVFPFNDAFYFPMPNYSQPFPFSLTLPYSAPPSCPFSSFITCELGIFQKTIRIRKEGEF